MGFKASDDGVRRVISLAAKPLGYNRPDSRQYVCVARIHLHTKTVTLRDETGENHCPVAQSFSSALPNAQRIEMEQGTRWAADSSSLHPCNTKTSCPFIHLPNAGRLWRLSTYLTMTSGSPGNQADKNMTVHDLASPQNNGMAYGTTNRPPSEKEVV